MGICSSCESGSVPTAKLILQHGQLVEFPYSVKVSYVLQQHPSCFICDSDSMEFQDFVPAMHADEELLPGQLYFALPLGKLRYPLQPEEMAALAVKASLALAKGGDTYKSCIKGIHELVNPKEQMRMGKKASRSSCKRSGRIFSASKSKLTMIHEQTNDDASGGAEVKMSCDSGEEQGRCDQFVKDNVSGQNDI